MLLKPLNQKQALFYAGVWDKELEVIQAYERCDAENESERWWCALAENECLPIEYLIDVDLSEA